MGPRSIERPPPPRATPRRIGARLAIALCALLPGCAELLVPDRELVRLGAGRIDPCQVAFVVHGMLKELGREWDEDLCDELSDAGGLGLVVTYWSDPTGVWFNWGSKAPARLLAALADDVARLHAASGCEVPLRVRALGFSNGGEVLLDAAAALRVATFDRMILVQSSSFAFSRLPDELIAAGRIQDLRVHWSPLDCTTLLAPLGAGMLGLWSGSDAVRHEIHWRPHLPPILRRERRAYRCELLDDDTDPAGPAPWSEARARFARDLARWLGRVRSRA